MHRMMKRDRRGRPLLSLFIILVIL